MELRRFYQAKLKQVRYFQSIKRNSVQRLQRKAVFYQSNDEVLSTVKLCDKERLDSEQPDNSEQFCDDPKVPFHRVLLYAYKSQ